MIGCRIKYQLLIVAVVLLSVPCTVGQQVKDSKQKVQSVVNALKEVPAYGYKYTIELTYPDGNKETVKGEMSLDRKTRVMLNVNSNNIIYYSDSWIYKVDHDKKEVVVINAKKYARDSMKLGVDKDVFDNSLMNEFLDSFVLKEAKIQSVSEKKDTISFSLIFPYTGIRKMELKYNTKVKMPIYMMVECFYPWEGKPIKNGRDGTTQIIRCTSYNQKPVKNNIEQYFIVKNGKVVLNKFKDYKLSSDL
jgi:hypothetical protein